MNTIDFDFDINNKTKKNHFVPQVYLRFFKSDLKNDIFVYDKINKKFFVSNISDIGLENKLYVIEDNPSTSYFSWEDYYTKNVDNTIKDVFEEVISNTECRVYIKPLLSKNLKLKLINIIAHQLLRTHEKIYSFYEEYPKELDIIFQDTKIREIDDQKSVDIIKKLLKQDSVYKSFALSMVNRVANNSVIKKSLLNKTWIIFCNNTELNFITSDTPVVLYDYKEKRASTQNGIAGVTTLLAYPISPRYMIVFFPNKFYDGWLKLLYNDSRIEIFDKNVIKYYNRLQLDSCSKHIMACKKDDLLSATL